jgi:shikimate kinase
MNIILIGYRCSGKTSVGKIIAKRTGMEFHDTDVMIEKSAGQSIEEIVEKDGWNRFREIEKAVIGEASKFKNAVIATGGGAVTDEDNIKNLKQRGYVVWLEGDADTLMKRMEKDMAEGTARPSLTGGDPVAETRRVLEMRDPLYRRAADLVINTGGLSIDDVVEKIIRAFSPAKAGLSAVGKTL